MRRQLSTLAVLACIGLGSAQASSRVRTLVAGPVNTIAVAEDGTVWTWGSPNADSPMPKRVSGLAGIVAVAAGLSDNVALGADRTVWVWPIDSNQPRQVPSLAGSYAIAAGEFGLALKSDGTVWEFSSRSEPRQIPGPSGVMAISAASEHALALQSDGTVWAWGRDSCGQLGDGKYGPGVWGPVPVSNLSDVIAISAGGVGETMPGWFDGHSLALKRDGTVWEWGCQIVGLWSTPQPGPSQVFTEAVAIAAGGEHSLALKADGTVWSWGWDQYGQLGSKLPSGQIAGLAGVTAIAAGNLHSLAVKGDGTVWDWGIYDGGGPSGTRKPTPTQVISLPALLPDRLVVNAASLRGGPVAPGEIVTIYGIGLASSGGHTAKPSDAGLYEKSLVETEVLFDGVPAPVLFARTDQVTVAVPFAVAGKSATRMQTVWRGVNSTPQTIAVAGAAPGIFTVDASGSGQGAISNQDLSANSASNPAPRGSIVTLLATGLGSTVPEEADGHVNVDPLARPVLPVTAEVGGQQAVVEETAAAPGFVAGVFQVKVRIPESVTPGPAVPVTLLVGTARSQDGVSVAIASETASLVPSPASVRSVPPTAAPGDPSHGYSFFSSAVDLASYGYLEEEFTLEGAARRYNTPTLATGSVIDGAHPYRTRMIVRRPAAPGGFNGTVLMEWQNVTAGYDLDALWAASSEHFLRRGYVWVGVSAQRAGIHQAATGLRDWSPARYGTLDVTAGGAIMDDSLSYDIFSQAARAIRNPDAAHLLGGLPVEHVFAIGVSGAANRLATYCNSIQPLTRAFDAFVLVSGSGAVRTDTEAKVFKLLSETDVAANPAARQPDSDHHRRWEVAGSAHLDYRQSQALASLQSRDLPPSAPPSCDLPPSSRIPFAYAANAAYDHAVRWVKENVPPPTAPDVKIQYLGPPVVVARDSLGNALGGIRLPQHAVPTAKNTGVNSGPGFCRLFGTFEPFDAARLASLYPDHATYLMLVIDAALASLKSGFIVPEDAAAAIQEASLSSIPTP